MKYTVTAVRLNQNSTKNFSEELLKSGFAVILTKFCAHSEFGIESWAKKYGSNFPIPIKKAYCIYVTKI